MIRKSSNPNDLALAYSCASKYLLLLDVIIKDSASNWKEAAELATEYALIKTVLAWHYQGLTQATQYAKDALCYSILSENVSLQLSAYSKLAWAYFYDKKYQPALETAENAYFLLKKTSIPLPTFIQGGTYSTLTLMQAKNGINTDATLGNLTQIDPGNEMYALMQFTQLDMQSELGMIHCYRGDQINAMKVLETLVDPITLVSKTSTGINIEVMNTMVLSSLKTKNRDMEKTIHLWKGVIEGAKTRQSEWGFNEALTTYELIHFVWPDEPRITELRDFIKHW